MSLRRKKSKNRLSVLFVGDITAPSPANNEVERRMLNDKMHTLQLMKEQQSREVEDLRSSLARTNSKKIKNRLDTALKSLQDLESQITSLTHSSPDRVSAVLPSSPSNTFSPLPPLAPPRTESGAPPQLPPRNKVDQSAGDTAPAPPPRIPSSSGLPPPPPNKYGQHRHSSSENLHPIGEPVSRRGSQAAPPSPSPRKYEHVRTRSSPVSLENTLDLIKSTILGDGQKSPRYETPPGTPPPPYIPPGLVTWNSVAGAGPPDIITMDDSDDNMEEETNHGDFTTTLPPEGDHGPFNTLTELLEHPAHLAVFLNYVISNSNPTPLLFYLITDAYKAGSVKEMRRWAYEIYSCFLVVASPLELPNMEVNTIEQICNFLSDDNTDQLREENLKKLFWKVISKTRKVLKVQLDEFRATRVAGMGSIFGPADSELKLCEDNSEKRMSVINDRLIPILETMAEDLENATAKSLTLCSSLATVLSKTFNTKDQKALNIIDKIPTFVSREKKREKLFGREKKTIKTNGHNFSLKHFDQV